MSIDRERAMRAVTEFLAAMGVDPEVAELRRTPERVTDLAAGMFAQAGADPAEALGTPMEVTEDESRGQVVSVTDVSFRSICPHHLLPFEGRVDVTYAPRARLAGFSRIVKLVSSTARRPQLQERLGEQIADALVRVLDPRGVTVRIVATHGCVEALEPHGKGTQMVTVCTRGEPLT